MFIVIILIIALIGVESYWRVIDDTLSFPGKQFERFGPLYILPHKKLTNA